MSSQPTLIAPTQTQQINRALYVGKGYLRTIQSAVDFAATHDDQNFRVIIPAGYTGVDTIASIVRGTPTITLVDERVGPAIFYQWAGTYIPVVSVNGITTAITVLNMQGFNFTIEGLPPAPTTGNGQSFDTQYVGITAAVGQDTTGTTGQTGGNGGEVVITGAHGGRAPVGSTNGNGGNLILGGGYPGRGAGTAGVPGDVLIQSSGTGQVPIGRTFIGGTDSTNATVILAGGDLSAPNLTVANGIAAGGDITVIGNVTASGDITASGDLTAEGNLTVEGDISADFADLAECNVDNSPVRTFANTPDGPGQGMVWPTIGIPVSQGDAWQDPSIDPATLATYPPVGLARSTGQAWTASIDPTTLATWPLTAGVPVGTGAGSWGTSIPAASIPLINQANHFSAVQQFAAPVTTLTNPAAGTSLGWNMLSGTGETDFFNSSGGGGGGFFWYNGPPGTVFNSSSAASMFLDSANNLHVAGGTLTLNPPNAPTASAIIQASNDTNLYISATANIFFNWNSGSGGTFWGNGHGVQIANLTNTGNLNLNGNITVGTSISSAAGSNLVLNPPAGADVLLSWNSGAGTVFGNGAGGQVGSVDSAGNFTANGTGNIHGVLTLGSGGNGTITSSGGSSLLLNPNGGGSVFLNWNSGSNVFFGNGAQAAVATMDNTGALTLGGPLHLPGAGYIVGSGGGNIEVNGASPGNVLLNWGGGASGVVFGNGTAGQIGGITKAGVFTAVTKSFRIAHPLDDTKMLNHGCVEGPEYAVFYRGEGQTAEDGTTTITLPDYFEALTRPEGRTVQLTELFEDDADTDMGKLAASRVKDGQFRVRSEYASQKFYWEVKAVRADVDELEVVSEPMETDPNHESRKAVKS
jgi:hypothetical protein